jgi:hypothetical protein
MEVGKPYRSDGEIDSHRTTTDPRSLISSSKVSYFSPSSTLSAITASGNSTRFIESRPCTTYRSGTLSSFLFSEGTIRWRVEGFMSS